jgi:hypothetical protein
LCLYKVVEGLRARRTRLERAARRGGNALQVLVEIFPETPQKVVEWLNALFPVHREWDAMCVDSAVPAHVRGLDIQDFVTNTLKPLRDNVAHALTESSGELTVSPDELLDSQEITTWLPLLKCIVRRMLKNDFPAEFLAYLGEDGVVRV